MSAHEDLLRANQVFLRREAHALGYTNRQIDGLVAGGSWKRVRYGAYVEAAQWPTSERDLHLMKAAAAVKAAKTEVALSHTTSLLVHDVPFWDLDLSRVHLTTKEGACNRRTPDLVQHCGVLSPDDLMHAGGFAYTAPARLAVEIASITDMEHAIVVVSMMLNRGLITHEELATINDRVRSWPGTSSNALVFPLSNPRLTNVAEARTWFLLWRQQLPAPQVQYEVYDANGELIGILDFAWPELGVYLEFDGRIKYTKHARPGESATDVLLRERWRENRINEATGWIPVRLTWADLDRPREVALRIQRAFDIANQRRSA